MKNIIFKVSTCAILLFVAETNTTYGNATTFASLPEGLQQNKGTIVKGRICDKNGDPIIGANVKEKGAKTGTVTGIDGNFTLNVQSNSPVLSISFIGYATTEIPVRGQSMINIILKENEKLVNEVVVVGYGTQRKGDITSSIASVKSEDFNPGKIQDAAELIKGKVAGLIISNGSGDPNSSSNITLRGIATLQGNAAPLILVDGIPGDLSTVSPENIESIDVLKDASAAAIYGTRGANGVIIITTKTGHRGEGHSSISYNAYASASTFGKKADFMDAADVRKLIKEKATGFTDGNASTDWVKEISRTGFTQNHNVTLNGGMQNTSYSADISYRNENGVIKESNSEDIRLNFNLTQSFLNNIAKINLNFTKGLHNNNNSNASDDGITNIYRQAVIRNPTSPVYNSDGSYNEELGTYQYYNPMAMIKENKGEYKSEWTRITANLTVEPVKGWQTNLMVSRNTSNSNNEYYHTKNYYTNAATGLNGEAGKSEDNSRSDYLEVTSKYDHKFLKYHHISILAGFSYNYNVYEGGSDYNYDFPTDAFLYNNIGTGAALTDGKASMSSYKNDNKLTGFFGRFTYNFNDKYNLLLSLRHEGSSKFGVNHKWGNFPSASIGWTISNEPFMKEINFINNLKLRAGYGVTGEIPSSSYLSKTLYSYGIYYYENGKWYNGLQAASNPNPDLKWEKSAEFNVGVDFSVLEDRLSGSMDYYYKKTSDMLWDYNVPSPPNLYTTTLANVGKMRNTGVEVVINAVPVKSKNFQWKCTLTGSHNSNKLLSLSNALYQTNNYLNTANAGDPISLPTHRLEVGKSIGNYWGMKAVGLSDKGLWMIENPKTGKSEEFSASMLNDDYRQYLGNGIPKINLGFSNQLIYKNFDMSFQMSSSLGFKILNEQRMFYENNSIAYNKLRSSQNKIFGVSPLSSSQSQTFTSYYLENGNYLKLNNLSVGYTFRLGENMKKYITKLHFYLSGENLFCLTKYKGLDPELSNSDFMASGNDPRDKYPTIRSFTFGVNATF